MPASCQDLSREVLTGDQSASHLDEGLGLLREDRPAADVRRRMDEEILEVRVIQIEQADLVQWNQINQEDRSDALKRE